MYSSLEILARLLIERHWPKRKCMSNMGQRWWCWDSRRQVDVLYITLLLSYNRWACLRTVCVHVLQYSECSRNHRLVPVVRLCTRHYHHLFSDRSPGHQTSCIGWFTDCKHTVTSTLHHWEPHIVPDSKRERERLYLKAITFVDTSPNRWT